MVWLSTGLIVGFGAITLYLRDPKFIQMKPTIIYLLFAGTLVVGLLRRKPMLKWLFGPVFPGLSEEGWLKLSRNWALFFLALAVANEAMRATALVRHLAHVQGVGRIDRLVRVRNCQHADAAAAWPGAR